MFAALGSITFQVLASPRKLESNQKFHYAKLDVIGAAPILQWIYDDLQELTIEIYLHTMWCNPQTALTALQSLATTHQAQSLVFGNGVQAGRYVIAGLKVEQQWMADDGSLIAVTAAISLTQFVSSAAAVTAAQAGASANPPGLLASQTSAPGSAIVVAPATASPSAIPHQTPFTSVPASTIARGY